MKKIPFKAISLTCITLVVLVVARCAVTAGRTKYYGGTDWITPVVEDPWFLVGMIAAALSVISLILLLVQRKQN